MYVTLCRGVEEEKVLLPCLIFSLLPMFLNLILGYFICLLSIGIKRGSKDE